MQLRHLRLAFLSAAACLWLTSAASAQTTGGVSTGGSSSGTSLNVLRSGMGPGGSFIDLGGLSAATQGAPRGATSGVSTSNLYSPYFANPMSLGLPTPTGAAPATATFGTALFPNVFQNTAATTTVRATISTYVPLNTLNQVRRTPGYTTRIAFRYNKPTSDQVLEQARGLIARSESLTTAIAIQVNFDGQAIILTGTVPDDDQRRLAENLLRLTPGVQTVRNELVVTNATAAADQ